MNIGNPNEFTLLELAETVIELTGSSSEIVYEALPTDDPQVRQPDISLAKEILGWEPKVQLREGLERTIERDRASRRLVGAAACSICAAGRRGCQRPAAEHRLLADRAAHVRRDSAA